MIYLIIVAIILGLWAFVSDKFSDTENDEKEVDPIIAIEKKIARNSKNGKFTW